MQADPDYIAEYLEKRMEKIKRKMEKAQFKKVKNVKAVCMREAIDFVRVANERLMKMFTDEQHRIVFQFLSFKSRSAENFKIIE